jgi:hypothetical protein
LHKPAHLATAILILIGSNYIAEIIQEMLKLVANAYGGATHQNTAAHITVFLDFLYTPFET